MSSSGWDIFRCGGPRGERGEGERGAETTANLDYRGGEQKNYQQTPRLIEFVVATGHLYEESKRNFLVLKLGARLFLK
jgi:hypothetical protein